jgi:LysR family transcriptional activator of nhaA
MNTPFSYRHLYYFWVVAKEGGMAKAADRLDMAVQTVSTQVRELEKSLGYELLKPAGRGVALTDAGIAAMHQAELIFQLGEKLPDLVRDAMGSPSVRLAVGISEGLAKLAVRQLMQPVMHTPNLRLICQEDEFEDLLGELALHRLDVVLADRPAPVNPNLKVYSHSLGSTDLSWYVPPQRKKDSPSRWQKFRCCCPHPVQRSGRVLTTGLSAWASSPISSVNLKTAPCSKHLVLRVWAFFLPQT